MDPLLIDLPVPIITPRLLIRPPIMSDALKLNSAVVESFDLLHQWMEWAQRRPTLEDSQMVLRQAQAEWILRQNLMVLLFDRTGTTLIGASGYNFPCWEVPSFRIGYWVRKSYAGQGFITEAVNALTRYAFLQLRAARLEIRCDEMNIRSSNVAERLGYLHEATLRRDARTPQGALRNTRIYARYDLIALPELEVAW